MHKTRPTPVGRLWLDDVAEEDRPLPEEIPMFQDHQTERFVGGSEPGGDPRVLFTLQDLQGRDMEITDGPATFIKAVQ